MRFPAILILSLSALTACLTAAPIRVLVSSDDNGFRESVSALLQERGVQVQTASDPDSPGLAEANVLVLHQDKFEDALSQSSRDALSAFVQRGGGIVAIKGGLAAAGPEWSLKNLGGAWDQQDSRYIRNVMMLCVAQHLHPIAKGAGTFDLDDETYYDLTFDNDISVFASAFTPKGRDAKRGEGPRVPGRDVRATIYDIQPQMWAHEGANHRAAVLLQGAPESLAHNSVQTFLLRAVSWTAKRDDLNELCRDGEVEALRYPKGGANSPAETVKQFKMQPGFEATSIAAEPLINKPIAIHWDGAGRLWVAETPEYPNGRRPLNAPAWKEGGVLKPDDYDRPATDRISFLIDSDGDGVMDKKHIFHEGLELVTGFCFHEDGVIAVAHPHIVWLRDVDGNGVAETEVPLYGGFTPGDTHFVANHFVAAPDGWIYASTGSGAQPTNPKTGEVMARLSPGVFRFRADGSAIQQVASQGGNSFGGDVTSDMEVYHNKATNGNPIQHVVLPEWVLAKASGSRAPSFASVNPGRPVVREDMPDRAPLRQIDQVGRYSSACAATVYEGGSWPPAYDGKIFVTEPILDIIHHEELKPDGATYKGELVLNNGEWLRSMDHWFCPVDVAFGPDGAMYVLDFYTPVVAHNDTRGPQHSQSGASVRPDREHYYGRIYRIHHRDASKLPQVDLTHASPEELVKAFSHPSRTVRFNAQRIFLERQDASGGTVPPLLTQLATQAKAADTRILALWTLLRLDALKPETLAAALADKDSSVRKNAMLVIEEGALGLTPEQLQAGLSDNDGRVRLATLRALSASGMNEETSKVLLASSGKLDNDWLKAAAAAASAANASSQLATILGQSEVSQDVDSVRALAAALSQSRDRDQIVAVLNAAAKSPHTDLVVATLGELARIDSLPRRGRGALVTALRPILKSRNPRVATAALPLAAAWDTRGVLSEDVTGIATRLFKVARGANRPEDARSEAIKALLQAHNTNKFIVPNMIELLGTELSDSLATTLINSLSATGAPEVGPALVAQFPKFNPGLQEVAFTALVSRPEWAGLVLDATQAGAIAGNSLAPAQISRLTAHPDAAVAKRAQGIFSASNQAKDELIAELLPHMSTPANVENGKMLFGAMCSTCHILGGTGYDFGPNLDGMGSHPVLELLTHIVNPNLVVDDEHRTWNITMKDGTQHSALIATENEARVQLSMPAGVTIDLPVADIAKREKGANSLMPEGLEAMGKDNLRDIIAYLQSTAPKEGE